MDQEATPAAVQKYLDGMAGDTPADPIIRALLDRATRRLYLLCASLLHRKYPRLARPPLNLDADEMLGAVVERLLKAFAKFVLEMYGSSLLLPISTGAFYGNELSRAAQEKDGESGLPA